MAPQEQQEYLTTMPKEIGNLDGIPAEVRDEANRAYLPVLKGDLSQSSDPEANTKLDGLEAIDKRLKSEGKIPMYLLGIGDEGNGRAIVSFGNPDTARNVSTYVPGLNTKLDEKFAGGDLNRAHGMAERAGDKYGGSTASIAWLGYDAPQVSMDAALGLDPSTTDVTRTDNAERAVPALQNFTNGLEATNQNADPHLTAIGHSYGSLTVGTAAAEGDGLPGVDDIVLVGSPGSGSDHASDLNVGAKNVYVRAADSDLVTHAPSKGDVAGAVPEGVTGLPFKYWMGGGDDRLWFGTDPASERFGAQRFLSAEGDGPSSHSNYFNAKEDLPSADNIARVVTGNGDSIERQEHR
ncbi:alpha/beta hydrolase [Streptomyces iconiensis]|uniref:alpha/beta hydrolase n=1 Tax=Streptomyces iconiensis TaxID=1384038 RepID=UPI003219F034